MAAAERTAAPAAAWSEALEVFSQDFETAMEIWMYQDPVVERLYCDERRATRRRSVAGSQDALQSQSQSQSQRSARKRRRRSDSSARVDAPALTPPLSLSSSLRMIAEPTQTQYVESQIEESQTQFVESQTQFDSVRRRETMDSSVVAASEEESEGSGREGWFVTAEAEGLDDQHQNDGAEVDRAGALQDNDSPDRSANTGIEEDAVANSMSPTNSIRDGGDGRLLQRSGPIAYTSNPLVPNTTRTNLAVDTRSEANTAAASRRDRESHVTPTPRTIATRFGEMSDRAKPQPSWPAASISPQLTVPSLFQTGSGKSLRVLKRHLQAYEDELLVGHAETATPSTEEPRVSGLFQTGSGKPVRISKAQLSVYEKKLMEPIQEEGPSSSNSLKKIEGRSSGEPISDTMVPGLFQTGSGKNLRVSASRIRDYEAKLRDEIPESMGDSSVVTRSVTPLAPTTEDTEATVVGLFQTGSGKNVHIAASRLRDYEAKLLDDTDVNASTAVDGPPPPSSTVNSLFQTGSGKNVRITASKLRDYEKKMMQDSEAVETNTALTDKDARAPDSTVASLFQTGSGKSVRVSKARLSDYELKLQEDNKVDDSRMLAQRVDSGTSPDQDRTVTSLFQTGSGKTVRISKERLRDYEDKLREDEVSSNTVAGSFDIAASESTVSSLFQTGSGKNVRVAKDLLQNYESKFQDDVGDADPDDIKHTPKDPSTTVAGLFHTGSGNNVRVSKERLQEYKAKLQGDGEDVVAAEEHVSGNAGMVAGLFQTGSGKNIKVSKERLREIEAKLQEDTGGDLFPPEASRPEATVVAGLFQTGSGKDVHVSKEKLQVYEAKLREEHDDASAVANLSTNPGALRSDPDAPQEKPIALPSEQRQLGDAIHRPPPLASRPLNQLPPDAANPRSHRLPAGKPQWTQRPPKPGKWTFRGHSDPQYDKENRGMNTNPAEDDHGSAATNTLLKGKSSGDNRGLKAVSTGVSEGSAALKLPPTHNVGGLTTRKRHVGDKRKFRPPVPKANTLPRYPEVRSSNVTGTTVSHTPKRPKPLPSPVRTVTCKFQFKEVLKVSFQHLQQLEPPHGGNSDGDDTAHLQSLASVTATTATNVIFRRHTDSGHLPSFHVRRSLDEPYDVELFMGMKEIYDTMAAMDLLEHHDSASKKASGATLQWFANHYRWIVWKLAAMEITFPRFLLGKYLTKDQVIFQMHRRVQRDIVLAERSVLKKMLNRDSSSLSCMVLCIAAVLPFPKRNDETLEVPDHFQLALVLTDGWYAVYAVPDDPLAAALWRAHSKSSVVGTKLAVWNAALRNSTEGIDPLECAIARNDCNSSFPWKNPLLAAGDEELTQWPYLELHYNSTRRVRFGERLGAEQLKIIVSSSSGSRPQRTPDFTLLKSVPLRSLVIGGGMVRSVRVVIKRISPVLHLQSKEWAVGPRILTEEHMHTYMELRGRLQQQLQGDVDPLDADDRPAFDPQMPTPFVKFEVECAHVKSNGDNLVPDCAVLTVWRPREEMLSGGIREGDEYFVSSLSVGWKLDGDRMRGGAFLRLSSTKSTTFQKVASDSQTEHVSECLDIGQAMTQHNEDETHGRVSRERKATVDVCVFIVSLTAREENSLARPRAPIDPHAPSASLMPDVSGLYKETSFVQHAFVTDQSRRLMCVRIPSSDVALGNRGGDANTRKKSVARSGSFIFRRGGASTWREGAIVCLRGLEVSHYDERLELLDCLVVESTQIVTFPSSKSHFSPAFSALQRAVTDDQFMAFTHKLKRYVDRRVFGMDIAPSQNGEEFDEVEHLTQDLLSQQDHPKEATASIAAQYTHTEAETKEVVWEVARIVRLLPLPTGSRSPCDCEVAALALLALSQNDNQPQVFRTVYLPQPQLFELNEVFFSNSISADASPSVGEIVQDLNEALQRTPLTNDFRACRVSARCETSARLLNSPRRWERANASFWVATHVESSK